MRGRGSGGRCGGGRRGRGRGTLRGRGRIGQGGRGVPSGCARQRRGGTPTPPSRPRRCVHATVHPGASGQDPPLPHTPPRHPPPHTPPSHALHTHTRPAPPQPDQPAIWQPLPPAPSSHCGPTPAAGSASPSAMGGRREEEERGGWGRRVGRARRRRVGEGMTVFVFGWGRGGGLGRAFPRPCRRRLDRLLFPSSVPQGTREGWGPGDGVEEALDSLRTGEREERERREEREERGDVMFLWIFSGFGIR